MTIAISAGLVKELREKTGAGMMDCKKALTETAGDFEQAIDWLRAKGLSAAAKKADRVAAEGLVAVAVAGNKGAIIEINSETDFVALNQKFQSFVTEVAHAALSSKDIEQLKEAKMPNGKTVADNVVENIATIGENLNLRRMQNFSVENGVVASYVHNSVADNLGKIAVLIALESKADSKVLTTLGKQLAMHVAATAPHSLTSAELDPALVQRERDIFFEQSRASGKPDNIIEKMVDGRIRKFYEEAVLLEQVYVIDGKTKISDVIEQAAKEAGTAITLKSFVRYELGEGIEQEAKDFAAEVAAVSGR